MTDYGVDARGGDLPYLVMEHLSGHSLGEILKQRKALPFEEAIGLLRPAANAVDAAHANNIVHGDLKPGNLFVTEEANGQLPCLKVLDFGLARLTQTGSASASDSEAATISSGGIRGTPVLYGPGASALRTRFAGQRPVRNGGAHV